MKTIRKGNELKFPWKLNDIFFTSDQMEHLLETNYLSFICFCLFLV